MFSAWTSSLSLLAAQALRYLPDRLYPILAPGIPLPVPTGIVRFPCRASPDVVGCEDGLRHCCVTLGTVGITLHSGTVHRLLEENSTHHRNTAHHSSLPPLCTLWLSQSLTLWLSLKTSLYPPSKMNGELRRVTLEGPQVWHPTNNGKLSRASHCPCRKKNKNTNGRER